MATVEGEGERPSVATAVEPDFTVFTILVRVMRGPPPSPDDDEGVSSLPTGRTVLRNPLTQTVVVLQGDAELIGVIADLLSRGRRLAGPPPASKASIESLKIVSQDAVSERIEDDCPVCLDWLRFSGEEKGEEVAVVKEMPCRHRFHGICIEEWLRLHGSCPLCRFQMPLEEDGEKGKNRGGDVAADGGIVGYDSGERRRRDLWVTVEIGRREGEGEESQTQEIHEYQPSSQEEKQQEMARRRSILLLVILPALLFASFSQAQSRRIKILRDYNPRDDPSDSAASSEEMRILEGRVMRETEMDYQDPGANTNPKTGVFFNSPPASRRP